MHLINIYDFRLLPYDTIKADLGNQNPAYIILSHRWNERPHDVSKKNFKPWQELRFRNYPTSGSEKHDLLRKKWSQPDEQTLPYNSGVGKIAWACETIRQRRRVDPSIAEWLWIDTCCINTRNKRARNEEIRCMIKYYQDAQSCYVYLKDVSTAEYLHSKAQRQDPGLPAVMKPTLKSALPKDVPAYPLGPFAWSEWHDRGWTLPELLVPKEVLFFSHNWIFIDTRANLVGEIEKATGIARKYLDGRKYMEACIAVKMSWMARRRTAKLEDTAYCMMGLFGVNLSINYGEQAIAFMRLQTELVAQTDDESIFAWTNIAEEPIDKGKILAVQRQKSLKFEEGMKGKKVKPRMKEKRRRTQSNGLHVVNTDEPTPPAARSRSWSWRSETSEAEKTKRNFRFGLLAPWPTCFANSGHLTINRPNLRRSQLEYRSAKDYGTHVSFPVRLSIKTPTGKRFASSKERQNGEVNERFEKKYYRLERCEVALNCWVKDGLGGKAVVLPLVRPTRFFQSRGPWRREIGDALQYRPAVRLEEGIDDDEGEHDDQRNDANDDGISAISKPDRDYQLTTLEEDNPDVSDVSEGDQNNQLTAIDEDGPIIETVSGAKDGRKGDETANLLGKVSEEERIREGVVPRDYGLRERWWADSIVHGLWKREERF